MRGKIVVVVILLAGAVMFAYSLWFISSHTPVDERFNMQRTALPDGAPGPALLPERAGDYDRLTLAIDTLDAKQPPRHGNATYSVEGQSVLLEVQLLPDGAPSMDAAFADFSKRAGIPSNDNGAGVTISRHETGKIHYGFGVYSGPRYIYYEFTWINGNWLMRASTRSAGSEALLRFVNGYVF